MRPLPRLALLTASLAAAGLGAAPAAMSEGDRVPKLKILGSPGTLRFEVRPRDACDSFAPDEVKVRFHGAGVTRNFVLDEPCGEWDSGTRGMPSVRISPEDGTSSAAGRLRLRALGDKPVERSFAFAVRIDGDLVRSGTMKLVIRKNAETDKVERFLFVTGTG